jgi:hypothetical protein
VLLSAKQPKVPQLKILHLNYRSLKYRSLKSRSFADQPSVLPLIEVKNQDSCKHQDCCTKIHPPIAVSFRDSASQHRSQSLTNVCTDKVGTSRNSDPCRLYLPYTGRICPSPKYPIPSPRRFSGRTSLISTRMAVPLIPKAIP